MSAAVPPADQITAPLGFQAWSGRGARGMAAEHQHGDVEVNFSPTATFRYMLGGVTVAIPPGRVGLFWATVPHRLIAPIGESDVNYWMTVPLHVVLGWSLPDAFVRDLLAGRLLVDRAASKLDELQLSQWVMDLPHDAGESRHRTAALEVEARFRRMAMEHGWTSLPRPGKHPRKGASPHTGLGSSAPQRMAHFIADRYADAIGVTDVARHVALNPNYAMTIFRDKMGMSIIDYLTRQRVVHAQRLLVTTDRPVLEVGFDAGFGSVSRYYAAFKAITGRSPKSYRRAVRPGG